MKKKVDHFHKQEAASQICKKKKVQDNILQCMPRSKLDTILWTLLALTGDSTEVAMVDVGKKLRKDEIN